jgi:hypothetical protein
MKTTKKEIEKALQKFRIQYQKAKERYEKHISPDGHFIVEDAMVESFKAQILEQKAKNKLNLIRICNDHLRKNGIPK